MPDVAASGLRLWLSHGSAILYQKFRLGHVLYHVLESLAHKLDFVPVENHRKRRYEDILADETYGSFLSATLFLLLFSLWVRLSLLARWSCSSLGRLKSLSTMS